LSGQPAASKRTVVMPRASLLSWTRATLTFVPARGAGQEIDRQRLPSTELLMESRQWALVDAVDKTTPPLGTDKTLPR